MKGESGEGEGGKERERRLMVNQIAVTGTAGAIRRQHGDRLGVIHRDRHLPRSNKPKNATLWKLHLRHGHRNFADLSRQYGMPVPKEPIPCTSCIMAKSHVQTHKLDPYEKAGATPDFKGPPAHNGALYLLTIIDDYSRRIFGFLVKSTSEWLSVWTEFVKRVEAEIGRQGCRVDLC